MSAEQSPQNLPIAGAVDEEQTDAGAMGGGTGPAVGTSDAEADEARSGAEDEPTRATHDSDGTPVGRDDLEADRRASGG